MTWLRRFERADPGSARLVCFPHAGGTASAFVALARELAPAVEVVAVQYPGRQDRRREPAVTDLRAGARRVVEELARLPAAGPTAYFGHSMGAVVAFEAALLATAGGGATGGPRALFASGARAPSATRVDPRLLASERMLVDEVVALGATSVDVLADPDLRAMVLPPLRADYTALLGYTARPDTCLTVAVEAIVGDRDPRVTVDAARGWERHTTGPFTLRVLPGDHFYLVPRVREVAHAVRTQLAALV